MKKRLAAGFLFLSAFILNGSASYADTKVTAYPVEHVIAVSYQQDTHQSIQIATNVTYPNGCFAPLNTSADINRQQRSIVLSHLTKVFDGTCTQAIVHQYPLVSFRKPENGNYQVWDAASNRLLGILLIREESVGFERSTNDPSDVIKEGGNYL